MAEEIYTPISCGLYDLLEAAAVKGIICDIKYLGENGEDCEVRQKITQLQSENKVEYMILEDSNKIRLDKIIALNGEPFPALKC